MHDIITILLNEASIAAGYPACDFTLVHPDITAHGDIAANIALVLGKSVGENPRTVAEKIVAALPPHESIQSVTVAGPGFINFHFSRAFFTERTAHALSMGDMWGSNTLLSGERIIVEYTDPNPFKELHIGHLVPNALGESLACLSEMSSAEVKRVTFQGDVGMHVAKTLHGLTALGFTKDSPLTPADLGLAYAKGSTLFDADETEKEKIKALNKVIYTRTDDAVNTLYDKGKAVSLLYFDRAYTLLGTHFDHLFFESVTGPIGAEVVRAHIGDVFTESDGAVVYEGEKRGLHTRVFINSEGLPTYEAKDIGLIKCKFEWWPFTRSITVTGTEQREYFKVVSATAGEVMPELAGKVELVPNGMLRLSEGKMSSRTGNVVRALDLVETVTEKIRERMADADISNKEETAVRVAVGAIKFTILRSAAGKDIIFDFEKSISFEGDSGPYLQYTHARILSVIAKAHEAGVRDGYSAIPETPYQIEHTLYQFPEVILRASSEREPHHVVTYLLSLASEFNSFYATERIADSSDTYAPYKLALARAVALTLKNGLHALGIAAPEQM